MPKKKKAAAATKPKTESKEEKTDAVAVPLIDAGSASIVFSPSRLGYLVQIFSYCDLKTFGANITTTSKTWDRVASTMTHVWEDSVHQCYPGNLRVPQWFRNAAEPRRVLSNLNQSSLSNRLEEEKCQCLELSIPLNVAKAIESWKEDVILSSEEVGVKNFCRWDLIDAVKEETAIRYSFIHLASDVYFTAINTAASRLGVTSCCYKTWISGATNLKENRVTVATIDGENYNNYSRFLKRSGPKKGLLHKGTFDGTIVFEVLPGVGTQGRASVDWHTRA